MPSPTSTDSLAVQQASTSASQPSPNNTNVSSSSVAKHQGPVVLLKPNSVPVWAAHLEKKSSTAKNTASPNNASSPSTSSDAIGQDSESSKISATSQVPPSPILAATKTTVPLHSVPEGPQQSGISRWKEFVTHSQLPGQTKTENDLQNMSNVLGNVGAARERLIRNDNDRMDESVNSARDLEGSLSHDKSAESGEHIGSHTGLYRSGDESYTHTIPGMASTSFFHKKRQIIDIQDLEKQMDLSGSWNPAQNHSSSDIDSGRPDTLAVPENAVSARRHHGHADSRSLNSEVPSTFSQSSVNSHFMMTADLAARRKRSRWKLNFRVMLLNNPYVPMTLRAGIFVLSMLALALASSIHHFTKNSSDEYLSQKPSTIMAICVQSCALIYLVYITYDEYSGKPLGLRDAKDKVKLCMYCNLTFFA